jgi:hypothetical protein
MIDWLTYTSIFFVVVPMLLSALMYRAFKFAPPLFYLLAVGFITDLFNLYTETYPEQGLVRREVVWIFYSIFECAILLWIVQYRKNLLTLKSLGILAALSITLWLLCHFVYRHSILQSTLTIDALSFFILVYQAFVIFYSARELLMLAEERMPMTRTPAFWIFAGIFFYAIGTFFIMSLLYKPILDEVYEINNVVNISTHVLFLVGLSVFMLSNDKKSSHRSN